MVRWVGWDPPRRRPGILAEIVGIVGLFLAIVGVTTVWDEMSRPLSDRVAEWRLPGGISISTISAALVMTAIGLSMVLYPVLTFLSDRLRRR